MLPAKPRPSGDRPRRRLGLALGAGGARGLAHVGVLKGLSQAGIPVDAIVGTSIGALVGAIHATGQLENFEREVAALEWPDVVRLFDLVWPRSGLVSGERMVEWLGQLLGDWKIEDLPIPYAAVAVDLASGEEVLIREGRLLDAVRASVSIPGIFVPVLRDGRVLVDGALRNPVPVSDLAGLGVDVRAAVNLHARPVRELATETAPVPDPKLAAIPAGPPHDAADPHPPAAGDEDDPDADEDRDAEARLPWPARLAETLDRGLGRLRRADRVLEPNGPNLFEILTASMTVLEHEIARHRLASDPVDVVLAPRVEGIRSLEFHKARAAIDAGHREVALHVHDLQERLRRRRWFR